MARHRRKSLAAVVQLCLLLALASAPQARARSVDDDQEVVAAEVGSDGSVEITECGANSEDATCKPAADGVKAGEEKPPLPWGQTHIDWPQLSVRFHNQGSKPVELHYQTGLGEEDMHFGQIPARDSKQFNTYHGAAWYITEVGESRRLQTVYVVDDDGLDDYYFDSEEVRERKKEESTKAEREFRAKYKEETGRQWVAQYPRDPPVYHMYKAETVGDVATVKTRHLKWHEGEPLPDISLKPLEEGQEQHEFRVETLSISPQVFAIYDVLSKDECDFMIERSKRPGRLKRSLVTTNAVVSKVRTSSNAWFPREESPVIENIFNRIANVLQMPEEKLRHDQCAENIQLVFYNETQEYQKHHDYLDPRSFKESANVQRGNNRFATILFYLNEIEDGGETFFPRSSEGNDFKVKLPVGSAVLFYSMLDDGNLDVMSEHGGLPVLKGEKYVANLWVWEPRWI